MAVTLNAALLDACRLAHRAAPGEASAGHRCICGEQNARAAACDALVELLVRDATLRRLERSLHAFDDALFDVEPARVEAHLRDGGWCETSRDGFESRWERDGWVVTVGLAPGAVRPVDHLRETLTALEACEQRSRFEILAGLLPDAE